jgi:hypothetical protein
VVLLVARPFLLCLFILRLFSSMRASTWYVQAVHLGYLNMWVVVAISYEAARSWRVKRTGYDTLVEIGITSLQPNSIIYCIVFTSKVSGIHRLYAVSTTGCRRLYTPKTFVRIICRSHNPVMGTITLTQYIGSRPTNC